VDPERHLLLQHVVRDLQFITQLFRTNAVLGVP
jgi:hypothetical protein